jgi:outer membrane protein
MKKTTLAVLLSGLISSATMADTIGGVYIGGHVWDVSPSGIFGESTGQIDFNLGDEKQGSFFIALEHPIPMLPNIKIASTTLDSTGSTILDEDFEFAGEVFPEDGTISTEFDMKYVDYTLYYEVFDNGLFSFDFGLTARDLDGNVKVGTLDDNANLDVSEWVPMVYASTIVGLPLTGLNFFAEGNFLSFKDHTLYDYQAGVSYELIDNLAVDVNVTLGYRAVKLDLEDLGDLYSTMDFDGLFLGAVVHF